MSAASAILLPPCTQPAEMPNRSTPLEEIVVTAQRREQPAQTIPVALTTLTDVDLVHRQIDEVAALQSGAPNLQIMPAQGNSRSATIAMRGHVEGDILPTVDPAVGLFLDGVYIARVTGGNLDLVDIERVEVMRGPQGSAFGRNTIGGAINIVPTKPQAELSGSAQLLVGDYNRLEVEGVLNAPVADETAQLRLSARHARRDGFAQTAESDRQLGDEDASFLRAQVRLSPENGLNLNLAYDYSATDGGNQWITLVAAAPPATLVPAAAGDPLDSLDNYLDAFATTTHASHTGSFDSRVAGASATLAVPVNAGAIKLIVANRQLDLRILETDLDGTPYDLATQFRHEQDQRQNSVELQWIGMTADARTNWLAGVYYFDEQAQQFAQSNSLYPLRPSESVSESSVENRSASVYLQIARQLSSGFGVQFGARFVEDRRGLTSRPTRLLDGAETCSLSDAIMDAPGLCQATFPERRFNYVPFDASVSYSPADNSLMYAKYSRGHRAGGYNGRALNALAALPFDPEVVDAVEVGWKSDYLDDTLRLNVALFRSDYDDIQMTQIITDELQRPVVVNVNAGEARILGGELELAVSAPFGRLGLAIGRTDARYTYLEPGVVNVGTGSQFANIPEWTMSAAVDLPFTLRTATINVHADYSWRDDVFFGGDAAATQDSFGITNAMISILPSDSAFEASLWVRNVTDTHYLARAIYTGAGFVRGLPADPRTYGVTLRWQMGPAHAHRGR